ncbi:MAG: Amuc_1099 family pilus-like system protein [Akkermansiaceae bacterium]
MSWLSDHYEKVTLGAAITAMAALGYIGHKNRDDQANVFRLHSAKQNTEVGVEGFAEVENAKVSMYMDHQIHQADVDGRKVDLLTGIVLYSKRDDPKNPVDMLKDEPVHAGIPNTWWMENQLDPGYANAPERDPDDDGFTNREEYEAETDPGLATDYPQPVNKLKVVDVTTTQAHIKPREAIGGGKKSFFNLLNKNGFKLNQTLGEVELGGTILFKRSLMQKRFRFADLDKRRNANGVVDVIWVIEDLQPNKRGTLYRFDKRGDLDGHPDRSLGIMDSTAKLVLQALGEDDKPFEVEENTRFSLPFDDKAAQKPYLLKSIDLNNREVVVEYTDDNGERREFIMPFRN